MSTNLEWRVTKFSNWKQMACNLQVNLEYHVQVVLGHPVLALVRKRTNVLSKWLENGIELPKVAWCALEWDSFTTGCMPTEMKMSTSPFEELHAVCSSLCASLLCMLDIGETYQLGITIWRHVLAKKPHIVAVEFRCKWLLYTTERAGIIA